MIGAARLSWNARPMENRLVVRGTRGTIMADRFLQILHVHRVLPGPKFIGIVLNRPRNTAGGYFRKNYEAMVGYANK